MRLVQEEIAIAGRCFCIVIDGDDNRLHMLIAPTFSRSEITDLIGEPSRHHCRPPSNLSLSRSAQRSSILLSIRSSSASAEAHDISGILKLPDLTAQALNLTAHVLDFTTNEIDVWHVQTPDYRD
jgi:hypothetical protein